MIGEQEMQTISTIEVLADATAERLKSFYSETAK